MAAGYKYDKAEWNNNIVSCCDHCCNKKNSSQNAESDRQSCCDNCCKHKMDAKPNISLESIALETPTSGNYIRTKRQSENNVLNYVTKNKIKCRKCDNGPKKFMVQKDYSTKSISQNMQKGKTFRLKNNQNVGKNKELYRDKEDIKEIYRKTFHQDTKKQTNYVDPNLINDCTANKQKHKQLDRNNSPEITENPGNVGVCDDNTCGDNCECKRHCVSLHVEEEDDKESDECSDCSNKEEINLEDSVDPKSSRNITCVIKITKNKKSKTKSISSNNELVKSINQHKSNKKCDCGKSPYKNGSHNKQVNETFNKTHGKSNKTCDELQNNRDIKDSQKGIDKDNSKKAIMDKKGEKPLDNKYNRLTKSQVRAYQKGGGISDVRNQIPNTISEESGLSSESDLLVTNYKQSQDSNENLQYKSDGGHKYSYKHCLNNHKYSSQCHPCNDNLRYDPEKFTTSSDDGSSDEIESSGRNLCNCKVHDTTLNNRPYKVEVLKKFSSRKLSNFESDSYSNGDFNQVLTACVEDNDSRYSSSSKEESFFDTVPKHSLDDKFDSSDFVHTQDPPIQDLHFDNCIFCLMKKQSQLLPINDYYQKKKAEESKKVIRRCGTFTTTNIEPKSVNNANERPTSRKSHKCTNDSHRSKTKYSPDQLNKRPQSRKTQNCNCDSHALLDQKMGPRYVTQRKTTM